MNRRGIVVLLALGLPLTVIVALIALLAWAFTTESGSRWAIEQARPYLPENIRFERAHGVLAGPLELHGLVVRTAGATLRVERLDFDWMPTALIGGEARILELALAGVDIEVLPGDGAESPAGGTAAAPRLPEDLSLPLAIVVERLTVEDVVVRLPDGGEQRIERLALRASAGPDGLAIEGLEVSAPLANVGGSLHMQSSRPFELEGAIAWRLRLPEPAPETMTGRLEIGGSLERVQARLSVEQPAAARLQLQASLFRESPQWSGALQLPVGALRSWWGEAPELMAGADLQLEGSFTHAAVQGVLELEGLPTGPLRAQVEARGSADRVTLEHLRIEPGRRPASSLTASGEVDLAAAEPRFDVRLDWNDLAWPLDGTAMVTSESGTLALAGTIDAYDLTGDARMRTPQTGDEPIRLDWRATGSTEALSGLELGADWHETHLTAAGRIDWVPEGMAQLRLDLAGLDPARLAEPLTGRLGASAELHATWGDRVTAALDLESLEGELNGDPLSGNARLRYDDGAARIERLALNAGDAHVEMSGSVDQNLALDWRVAVPRLGDLVPAWGGRIDGNGRVTGQPDAPRIALEVDAAEVVTPVAEVAALTINGHVAPLGGGQTTLELGATDVVTEAVTLRSLALRVAGTPEDHRLEAELRSDRGDADFALAGMAVDSGWRGQLLRATLAPAGIDPWRLAEPVELAWHEGAVNLEQGCWRNGGARLCMAASGDAGGWRARLDAQAVPLELIASLARHALPQDDPGFTGTFDLEADLAAEGGVVTGQARLDLAAGEIIGVVDEESRTLLAYESARVELRLAPDVIALDGHLPLAGEGAIRLDGRIGRDKPRSLDGRLQARIEDLGLLVMVPAIGHVEGRLLADVELGGTLEQPSAAGSMRLEDGRLGLLPLGIELTDMQADLATGDDALEVVLAARSGEGELTADIRLERVPGGGWRGSGSLSGENFEAADLPEANVVISPELEWRLDGPDVSLSGEVTVPSARIMPRDLSGSVQVSPDTEIVGVEAETEEAPPLRVTADVTVTLGPDVRIDAFGLESRLAGSIRVHEQPGQLTSANGELRVEEGTYTIYAQKLRIERGRVIYDGGPVANPGLDVRAVRRPGNVLVGVNVRGTLREPRVDLFSEPPMEQSQQLSYLIVGLPLGETSSGQQSSVAAAAAALAGSEQGTRLASRFGVQEVTVDQDDSGAGASLVLGRYLSPRLYVGYGIGFAEEANSVRMRYTLTDQWSLEARSGMTSAADLLYSIEVDSSIDAVPLLPGNGDAESRAGDDER